MSRPHRWNLVLLSLGAASATLSILFVGWLEVWFQIGTRAQGGDYLQASGLYAGGVVWLGLASVAAWPTRAPTWLRWSCWCGAGLFALLCAGMRLEAADREPTSGFDYGSFAEGFRIATTQMPWCWLVVVAAFLGLLNRRRTSPDVVSYRICGMHPSALREHYRGGLRRALGRRHGAGRQCSQYWLPPSNPQVGASLLVRTGRHLPCQPRGAG